MTLVGLPAARLFEGLRGGREGCNFARQTLSLTLQTFRLPFRVGLSALGEFGAELNLLQVGFSRGKVFARLPHLCGGLREGGLILGELLLLLPLLPLVLGRVLLAAAHLAALQAVVPRHLLLIFVLQIGERTLRAALFPKLGRAKFRLLELRALIEALAVLVLCLNGRAFFV